jgi:hypothetical protein
MSAIPLEAVTLLGSSILGTVSKLVSIALNASHEKKMMELKVMSAQAGIIDQARRVTNPHFQWTRRAIALMAVFFIIAWPKIVAVFAPGIEVAYGYSEASKGFLWFDGPMKLMWQNVHGLAITPLDTHMLAAIIGLYFGGSLARE